MIIFVNPSCRNLTYPRFALYVLGADWYNFVADPDILYGDLDGLIGMAVYLGHETDSNVASLVGGLEHDFYFSISWECHHPN